MQEHLARYPRRASYRQLFRAIKSDVFSGPRTLIRYTRGQCNDFFGERSIFPFFLFQKDIENGWFSRLSPRRRNLCAIGTFVRFVTVCFTRLVNRGWVFEAWRACNWEFIFLRTKGNGAGYYKSQLSALFGVITTENDVYAWSTIFQVKFFYRLLWTSVCFANKYDCTCVFYVAIVRSVVQFEKNWDS